MDFHLSKEQEMIRKMYREFAETGVKPLAEELDEEDRFPMETVEKMAKLGMMGIYFPKQYGGAGGDVLSYAMCVEELAKVCGTTAVIVSAHTSLCCAPIFEHGTEEQKMKYLPDLLSGKKIGAFGLTEPNAGTDASGQQTMAVLEGDHYVLNGSKCFITNGNVADLCHDRQEQGQPRHLRFHRGEGFPRLLHRQAREEDGHPRLLHLRPDL